MLGLKIKEYLTDTGLKYSEVANEIGLPVNALAAMLNGERKITAEEYFDICRALDVPLDKFISEM